MTKPEMTQEQLDEKLANRPAVSVTKEKMDAKIKDVSYARNGVHTICYITLENGFIVHGSSACAHPDNYDKDIGEKIAYDNAFRQIGPLEGYLLKEQLFRAEETKSQNRAA